MDRSSVALSRRSFLAASLIAAGATSSPAWLSLGCQRSSAPEDFTGKERFEATLLRAEAKEVQRWGLTVKEPAKGAT